AGGRVAARRGRVGRGGGFLPGGARVVRPVQLDAEMAEVERGVELPVARVAEHGAHGIAEERDAGHAPVAIVADQVEQPLAGGDEQAALHRPYPPVKAGKTNISSAPATGSLRR